MKSYTSNSYGDKLADVYDTVYSEFPPYPGQIEMLADFALNRQAVELGIGTGRIALALAESGVNIFGIDTSESMLQVLNKRSRGLRISSAIDDASSFSYPPKSTSLVFAVFNFIFLLPGRDAQIGCFRSAAKALQSGGKFVIEAFVPKIDSFLPDGASPGFFPSTSAVHVRDIDGENITIFASKNFPEKQTWKFHDIHITNDSIKLHPCVMHYLFPAEIDEIAESAGMRLEARFEDWVKSPFNSESQKHISIYTPI